MPQFDANLDLLTLNGRNGFQISGEALSYSGFSVSSAGDVNGDGFADLIIGAMHASPHDLYSGASYVVFGKAGGFNANLNLATLDGRSGFQISGESTYDYCGWSVSSAGDVNGDGFDDVIVGAKQADPHGDNSGASYVVFGKAGRFAANINLSALDGRNGFKISGEAAGDGSGLSVSSTGDINGDGFDDVIIGALGAARNGASYVVFGKAGHFTANINLAALDGSNGFKITNEVVGDGSGRSVSSAGDVNGDGLDDLVIGAIGGRSGGFSYVVFGKTGKYNANFDLSSLDGGNGFKISGKAAGDFASTVSSAGDVNGDGYDDLVIGGDAADLNGDGSGASYVVFGKAAGFGARLDLSRLDGRNGFQISGEAAGDSSGHSVSSAGDINGDGFDDVIIGADKADPRGYGSGASYVVFGKATGFKANLDLSELDGNLGFKISGEAAGDQCGFSVSSAGDVNSDGFDDLIVGASEAVPNGFASGASYVIFGHRALTAVKISGTGIAQTSNGGYGGDTISGRAGNDTLVGWEGADQLLGGNGNDKLSGGRGKDNLTGGAGDDVFRYDAVNEGGDKITDFARGGLSGGDRIDVSRIDADARGGDDDFAFGGRTATAHGVWYRVQSGNATVFVDTDGDKATAEMTLILTGVTSLNQGDFIL